MPRFTVRQGKRYEATVMLGLFQSAASNEIVADKFREVGFTDVVVIGSGRTRAAKGSWPHPAQSADIPDEIREIHEIGQIEV
ncbi:MAG TPA: hypothetical protein VMW57_04840 [Methyloceanibacter sp.]|jgi:hypothetical protein|nr:hypothetical protein [Methyloceanibacter sp.]